MHRHDLKKTTQPKNQQTNNLQSPSGKAITSDYALAHYYAYYCSSDDIDFTGIGGDLL